MLSWYLSSSEDTVDQMVDRRGPHHFKDRHLSLILNEQRDMAPDFFYGRSAGFAPFPSQSKPSMMS